MREWQQEILRCPLDRAELEAEDTALRCVVCQRRFPLRDGIPSFVSPELAEQHEEEEWQRKQREMRARDAQARRYDRLIALRLLSPIESRLTLRALRGEAGRFTLLAEVGCGTGRMLQHLAVLADYVVGVDFSLESLRRCRVRMQRAGFWERTLLVHADACFLPLASEALDAVASCQLVEHLPSDRLRQQMVSELARVLKTGGRYAISGYHWSWWVRWGGDKQGMHRGGIPYYRFTRQEFHELLSRHLPVQSLRSVAGYVWLASGAKEA
ncbi:MAG: methyltransferase domain-containing protein [Armatimonadota bacterium]|nr:methyltransferase domain-containing protein [Armatimonadota bacterium]